MKRFMFGMDQKSPSACAELLRERGIDAVVAGNFTPEAAAALDAQEIEMYLSCGAYGIKKDSDRTAQDAFGRPQRWFNSGCPNDHENASALLDAVIERASAIPHLKGILVDGARFASFASVEGTDPFFTCFCPRCMKEMEQMGLDAQAIRAAAGRLMQTRAVRREDETHLKAWLSFREACIRRYMDQFAGRVHALRSDLLAGAFIFAPSLGVYVGQTAAACRSLDVVSHMLYRDYHDVFGVACLGHEWAALLEAFGGQSAAFCQTADPASPFTVTASPKELLASGFEPEWVGREVAQARRQLPDKKLWPIIQIDDDRAMETERCSMANGADAVGFFAWGKADVPAFSE